MPLAVAHVHEVAVFKDPHRTFFLSSDLWAMNFAATTTRTTSDTG